jgi:ferrous-iron efflux pump FieF
MFCCPSQQEAFRLNIEKDRTLLRKVLFLTFFISLALISIKVLAYCGTHSLAVKAAVIDAIKDCLVSFFNVVAILKSLQLENPRYPFGAGKISALASLAQSLFLIITGGILVIESVRAFIYPHSVECSPLALLLLFSSLGFSGALAFIQGKAAKKTQFLAIAADSAHYKSDFIFHVTTLLCLFISIRSTLFDTLLGFGMALYLLKTAWKVGAPSLKILLDQALTSNDCQKIQDIVTKSHGHLKSLRTHGTGYGEFIVVELLESLKTLPLLKEKQCEIEHEIHKVFPRAFIVITPFIETVIETEAPV